MKKFSSCFFRYVLPVSVLACTISSMVKPMDNIIQQENKELAELSIQCNFKEFQLKALKDKLENDVKNLADEGHIVALWTKLTAWDGKLNKLSKSGEVDEFFTDLMKFFVILGVNCAQYYNFTDNHEQAQQVYALFKNYIMKTFGATIGLVTASLTIDYGTYLNNIAQWASTLANAILPSCGWVALAEIVWNKTGIFSGGFYTVQSKDSLKIDEFGSPAACELAQLYFLDLNQGFIKTIAKNKTWVEFINSKGDLIDALNVAAQSISRSVQALEVIKKQNQELKEWEELVFIKDSQLLKYNAVIENAGLSEAFNKKSEVTKNIPEFKSSFKNKKVITQEKPFNKKETLEAKEQQLDLKKRFQDIEQFDRQNLKIATTQEITFDLKSALESNKQEKIFDVKENVTKEVSEFNKGFKNKNVQTQVKALSGKEMYEQELSEKKIDEDCEMDKAIDLIEQKLIEMDIVEETPIIEQNK